MQYAIPLDTLQHTHTIIHTPVFKIKYFSWVRIRRKCLNTISLNTIITYSIFPYLVAKSFFFNLNHENTVFYDLNNIPKNKQRAKKYFFLQLCTVRSGRTIGSGLGFGSGKNLLFPKTRLLYSFCADVIHFLMTILMKQDRKLLNKCCFIKSYLNHHLVAESVE